MEKLKKTPGRPIKYLTGQSRDNANRIAWANSKRLKRQRAKEEEKNTVEKTTEEDTKSKIVPFDDTNISQDNNEVINVQNISVVKDAIDNVQQISQDNIVSSEACKTSYPITRWRENESERKTEKSTEEEHGHDKSVHFEDILDEQDHSNHMSITNDVAEEFESESLCIDEFENVKIILQDNDKATNIQNISLPKHRIVENVQNISHDNDKRKVKNIGKITHYSDKRSKCAVRT